jgi:hypothetical protein
MSAAFLAGLLFLAADLLVWWLAPDSAYVYSRSQVGKIFVQSWDRAFISILAFISVDVGIKLARHSNLSAERGFWSVLESFIRNALLCIAAVAPGLVRFCTALPEFGISNTFVPRIAVYLLLNLAIITLVVGGAGALVGEAAACARRKGFTAAPFLMLFFPLATSAAYFPHGEPGWSHPLSQLLLPLNPGRCAGLATNPDRLGLFFGISSYADGAVTLALLLVMIAGVQLLFAGLIWIASELYSLLIKIMRSEDFAAAAAVAVSSIAVWGTAIPLFLSENPLRGVSVPAADLPGLAGALLVSSAFWGVIAVTYLFARAGENVRAKSEIGWKIRSFSTGAAAAFILPGAVLAGAIAVLGAADQTEGFAILSVFLLLGAAGTGIALAFSRIGSIQRGAIAATVTALFVAFSSAGGYGTSSAANDFFLLLDPYGPAASLVAFAGRAGAVFQLAVSAMSLALIFLFANLGGRAPEFRPADSTGERA